VPRRDRTVAWLLIRVESDAAGIPRDPIRSWEGANQILLIPRELARLLIQPR
jgi:hypothetical protein